MNTNATARSFDMATAVEEALHDAAEANVVNLDNDFAEVTTAKQAAMQHVAANALTTLESNQPDESSRPTTSTLRQVSNRLNALIETLSKSATVITNTNRALSGLPDPGEKSSVSVAPGGVVLMEHIERQLWKIEALAGTIAYQAEKFQKTVG